ncbi:MAG: single-stranded DNA-binding protein [Chloroflexia bacterium]
MSKTLNKVTLIGRLGKDPEMKYIPSGVAVTKFSLATNRYTKPQDGSTQGQEETDWHNIVAWDKLADTCNQYLHKGSLVYLEGRLQTRSWEQDGQKRYMTEIIASAMIMLDPKESDGTGNGYSRREAVSVAAEDDDGLPF